jgi:putative peptidoglycan lipid II flippase
MGLFVGASWCELLARGFYTLGDTRTPTVVGAITLTIGLIVKWFSFGYGGMWAIAGSSSMTFLLTAVIMSVLLASQTHANIFAGCFRTLLWSVAAALVACAFCVLPYTFSLGRTWAAAPLGALVYGALIYPLASKAHG